MSEARPQDTALVDAAALRRVLPFATRRRLARLEAFSEIDSTSAYLLRTGQPPAGQLVACIADYQTAGRGRRGRRWTAPRDAALLLSVGRCGIAAPQGLGALPLVVGVVARRVIGALSGVEIELKWPNDLIFAQRKLGGVLVDAAGAYVVIGIGINVALPSATRAGVGDLPAGAVDLAQATGGVPPPRSSLAVALIAALDELLETFPASGASAYLAEFATADHLEGRSIRVSEATGCWNGIARGVASDGALRVETGDGALRHVLAGDVSVRGVG